jgi:hypothetical protein
VRPLPFHLPASVRAGIADAATRFERLVGASNVAASYFRHFGKRELKAWRLSPDASIQVSMQLAYARLHCPGGAAGAAPAPGVSVYESVSTKAFLGGRTEAMRSTTAASTAFVEAVLAVDRAPSAGARGRFRALRALRPLLEAATAQHRELVTAASKGAGVDRHLFALLNIAREGGGVLPALFSDAAWGRLGTSVLSTSCVNGPAIDLVEFGPVTSLGYGVGYVVKDDELHFALSNFTGDPDTGGGGFGGVAAQQQQQQQQATDAVAYGRALEGALLDLQTIASLVEKDEGRG